MMNPEETKALISQCYLCYTFSQENGYGEMEMLGLEVGKHHPEILSVKWSLPTYKVSLSGENLSRWLCMCKSKKIQLIPQALFYDPYSTLPSCYEKNILWPHKLARATSCIKPEGFLLAKLLQVFNTIMNTAYVNLPQEKRDATFFKLIKTHLSLFFLCGTQSHPMVLQGAQLE